MTHNLVKETDKIKAQQQIAKSSFQELNYDPTKEHIKKVEQWSEKWFRKTNFKIMEIVNYDAQPGENSTLYKTYKPDIPVRLFTTVCNTAIENISRFIESICAPLTSNLPNIIKETSHLLDLIDINKSSLPDKLILVSFDIINMFPNIDKERGMEAVRSLLDSRFSQNPSTECIMEGNLFVK